MNNFSTSSKSRPRARNSQNPEITKNKEQGEDDGEQRRDEEEGRARLEWDFSLSTTVSSANSAAAVAVSDALGAIEFDQSDSVVATGGIARKIRIYRIESLLPCGSGRNEGSGENNDIVSLDHATACDFYICAPAKLSSLKWRPRSGGRVIGSGDYDGVVMEYDLEKRVPVSERDEHGGRRVWSLDYSPDPVLGASGSDDGTMQMWDPRCEGGECVARVKPSAAGSAVCCVEFNPFGGSTVAVGCADRRVYGYDVRMAVDPVVVLNGHDKTVTYVKFLDDFMLVSAGIDGCLKLWNLHDPSHAVRTYKGHVNSRNFVGLSAWRNGGLLGCGSENNRVFVYDRRWAEPIWVHGFEPVAGSGFVSSVCWRQVGEERCTLVAGGSDGALHVFEGRRKAGDH